MLEIRPDQLRTFASELERAFRRKLRSALCESFIDAEARYPGTMLDELIDSSLGAAHAYGLTLETSLGDFVGLAVQFGPDFHLDPVVRDILNDRTASEATRIASLFSDVPPEVWRRIAEARSFGRILPREGR